MAKAAERVGWSVLAVLVPALAFAQPILKRTVRVDAQRVRLSEALALVARDGAFKLSYNAAALNGDSIVDVAAKGTVETVLRGLIGPRFELKETGNHIILLDQGGVRKKFVITGAIYDAKTGGPVAQASVHEVDGRNATSTDALGTFTLDVGGERDRTAVLVMRKEYHDTVVYVGRDGQMPRLALQKRSVVEPVEPICLYDRCGVEDLGVARLLVPNSQFDLASNLDIAEYRKWQISFIPNVSSNSDIAPVAVNNLSFNVLAGYARGLKGFEVGGVANIESHDVEGLQIAGFTNLVGRNTKGVQVAGAINHTMRTLEGVQIAGFGNTVWDTLAGVQIAGGANVVKGGLTGVQIAGACNVATQDVDGTQIAGALNVTPKDVKKAQIAGGVNIGRQVSGAQIAGGVNVALDSVGGGQVGFGANYAEHVSGGQVSFGVNVVAGSVSGGQVGFGANYAHDVTGGQFSFGMNVVPGKVNAGQVGFGLNYAHQLEGGQFSFGVNVVSGTAKGGQVGSVNYATRCEGWQIGVVNLSDTITGTSIGLLSIARRGYHRADISTTDIFPLSLTVRTGTRQFHNIFGVSTSAQDDGRWGFLYGFGSELRLGGRSHLNIELSGEQVQEQPQWIAAVNILGRFGVHYTYDLGEHLLVTAGPHFNLLCSDWRSADGTTYLSRLAPEDPLYQARRGVLDMQGWLGFRAGVGVRF
ncbi:MAG: hypothetical protein ACO1NQ_08410 [Flavobacteriales bacterium]